jgi:HD-GYP domain-containing protein (c-di-GMP phosphodiesterase class II)
LNTAILAATLGHKLEFDTDKIESLTHSALLHDIGMIKFSTELLNKAKLSNKEAALLERHTLIGFKILKDEMKMPEEVCLAALEHHENNDGSGYPYGISGNQISEMSQIIGICSFFDDLTSGKTKYKVKNTKDALKIMLEHGSRRFSPELLYKFVNMFKYNDIFPFDEMVR